MCRGSMVAYNAARVRDDVGTSTASAGRMPQGGARSGSVAAARTAAALAGASHVETRSAAKG